MPSFLAVSAFVSLFSFDPVSLFCFSALLSPFSPVTLSNSFLSLVLLLFQFQSLSSFLPSLSPPLYLSLLLSFAFSPFRSSTLLFPFSDFLLLSLTFSSFLLCFHFPWFFPSLVFLPFSASPPLCPTPSVLSLMSSQGHPCLRETQGSSFESGQVVPGLVSQEFGCCRSGEDYSMGSCPARL